MIHSVKLPDEVETKFLFKKKSTQHWWLTVKLMIKNRMDFSGADFTGTHVFRCRKNNNQSPYFNFLCLYLWSYLTVFIEEGCSTLNWTSMDVWSFYSAHHFEDSLKGASQRFEAFERQMEDSNTSRAAAIKEARKIYTLNIQKLLRIHSFRVSFFSFVSP